MKIPYQSPRAIQKPLIEHLIAQGVTEPDKAVTPQELERIFGRPAENIYRRLLEWRYEGLVRKVGASRYRARWYVSKRAVRRFGGDGETIGQSDRETIGQ